MFPQNWNRNREKAAAVKMKHTFKIESPPSVLFKGSTKNSCNSLWISNWQKIFITWKLFEYGVFSGPYFHAFELNTGKYGPEKTPYLDTSHAVIIMRKIWVGFKVKIQTINSMLYFKKDVYNITSYKFS